MRDISEGQRLERGKELFCIADLSRVWILADLFEKEARFIKLGTQVLLSLPIQQQTFPAIVSDSLPQFDGASRTLKVRLELDNPDFALKPDMFVDVEFPIALPEQVVVPAAAVLDTGLRKVVFVERDTGVFEPRQIETGRQFADEVQVVQGLSPGEVIAVSGNFLLDSESRMNVVASKVGGPPARDPVCGMSVDVGAAKSANQFEPYMVKTYYFCSDACKLSFERNPAKYVENSVHGYRLAARAPMSAASARDGEAKFDVTTKQHLDRLPGNN